MTEPMSYSDAAAILEAHNAWRRGQNDDTEIPTKCNPTDTRRIGAAIDLAIIALREMKNMSRLHDNVGKLTSENIMLHARCRALANTYATMDFKT